MGGHLNYRLANEDDYDLLLRLWEVDAGWGKFGVESLRESFIDTPCGPSRIVLAEDKEGGEIVGQFVFIPSLVSIDGREVPTLRPFAPILAKSYRFTVRDANPWHHPVAGMYRHAMKVLRGKGYGLIYMVPDPRWLRFFRMFPFLRCGSHPLWSRPLPLPAPLPLPGSYTVKRPEGSEDERINQLWEKAARLHGCVVVRTTRTLPYKVDRGGYITLLIEHGDDLVGLVSSRQKGGAQWMICDLLTADAGDSLHATLTAAVNLAHDQALCAPSESPIRKVAVLATPVMQPAVSDLGFARDAYDFPIVVHVLDDSIRAEDVVPTRWYVSAND